MVPRRDGMFIVMAMNVYSHRKKRMIKQETELGDRL